MRHHLKQEGHRCKSAAVSVSQDLDHALTARADIQTRVGLHLLDQYARGSPAWTTWRTNTSAPPPSPAMVATTPSRYTSLKHAAGQLAHDAIYDRSA